MDQFRQALLVFSDAGLIGIANAMADDIRDDDGTNVHAAAARYARNECFHQVCKIIVSRGIDLTDHVVCPE